MILSIHQPVYIPWLGLFHKILLADQFCIFDIVQYQTNDYNNRNLIKTHQGNLWLTVPVESKNHLQKKICDIKILNNGWNKKHIKSIELAYNKAPFYKDYMEEFKDVLLSKKHEFLIDLNSDILHFFLKALDIKTQIIRASDYQFIGSKSDLVLDICQKLKATKYISGSQGKNYLNIESFQKEGIQIYFQDYKHPEYNQLHGEFSPFMSTLDLLFNEGLNSKNIICLGN